MKGRNGSGTREKLVDKATPQQRPLDPKFSGSAPFASEAASQALG